MKRLAFVSLPLLLAFAFACAHMSPPGDPAREAGGTARVGAVSTEAETEGPEWAPVVVYDPIAPTVVDPLNLPPPEAPDESGTVRGGNEIESPISKEEADFLREEALKLPPDPAVQTPGSAFGPGQLAPTVGTNFAGNDATQCCGGQFTATPPDPEMAAGPNHVISVNNVSFSIYSKAGGPPLLGPVPFSNFFVGLPGCATLQTVFDPNVLYDEAADRFILAIDSGLTRYCIAATQTANPLGLWNAYSFNTNVGGFGFDYPHAGVGLEAIYMGANMFNGPSFAEGRVWAIHRRYLYNSVPSLLVVSRSTGGDSTPQPVNYHGFHQGTYPTGGPHNFLTDDLFNGQTYGVWAWTDPFNGTGGTFVKTGTVNLSAATGVTAGFPINATQQGGGLLQANDWRGLDAEYRNGSVWTANTISCNPGGGVVDCVRWARIDPTVPAVLDAGVFASTGQHRFFPDVAANHCNDMAIGYTRSASNQFAGVYATGRQSTDPPGTLQPEALLKAGERNHVSFEGSPYRWGDYTGMTPDPNGTHFWYVGEYAKNIPGASTWGTWISRLGYPCRTPDSVGVYIPAQRFFLLTNSLTNPQTDISFLYGNANLRPVYGDWTAKGLRTAGVYDQATATFQLTDEVFPGGGSSNVFVFGTPGAGEIPIAGDWDGDGDETIGVFDPDLQRFRLRNSNSAGPADLDFTLTLPFDLLGYQPVAGDWDGDGIDSIGVWLPRNANWYLKNQNASGPPDLVFFFGKLTDTFKAIAGDWNADGIDTVGLYLTDDTFFALKNTNTAGNNYDIGVDYGFPNALPVVH
ncbi:MAG TPA: hypothetical protein VNW71_24505 [Thermoanaerobaculia bacterium]|nr:hypothetical protein [Thermoanaerobaculia bacterium]